MKIFLERFYFICLLWGVTSPVFGQTDVCDLEEFPSWSLTRCAVENKDSLGLSKTELDSLWAKWNTYKSLELQNEGKKFNKGNVEYQLLSSVFTSKRMNQLVIIKSRKNAWNNAHRLFGELKGYGMISESNRESVLKELMDYELKKEVANEWSRINRTRENLFRICDAEDNIPAILEELDVRRKQDVEVRKKWRF